MNWTTKTFVKITEREQGQTMTEYALIMAAIAVVAYVSYKALGNAIVNILGNVTNSL
jgi:Flp pilus assembly pilin Flp